MEKYRIKCKNCNQTNCIKKGKRNGKQRYYCKICHLNFQDSYRYKAFDLTINCMISRLLKNGCGVMDVSRVLEISPKTVLSRMLKISNQLKIPFFNRLGCKFEVDEMSIKIANGKKQNWLIYGIEKVSKQVVAIRIGSRSTENISPLIDKILLLNPKRIYTDGLNIYSSLIPKEIHKRFQYCTNRIERKNLTLRTHIKRLSRKTICFSREKKYLEAHLRIYFWG